MLRLLAYGPLLLLAVLCIGPGQCSTTQSTVTTLTPPECALKCGIDILPQFQCLPQDPCYCKDAQLSRALTGCVMSTCSFADQLKAAKYRADSCGQPVRNRSHYTVYASPILFALAMGFIIARLLSRCPALSGAGYGADDYLVAFLAIPTIGMYVVSHFTIKNGSGQDVWELTPHEITAYLKWFLAGQVVYFVAVFGTKLSLVLLYLRIWPPYLDGRTWFHHTCYTLAAILIICPIIASTTLVLGCRPIAAYWDLALKPTAKCINPTNLHYGYASINLVLDLVILAMPISRILKLRISLPRKLGLLSTFAVGLVVTACSVIRLVVIKQTEHTTNPTWDFSPGGLLGVVEHNASIVTCCMPATAGLARRLWGKGLQPIWTSLRSQRSTATRLVSDASTNTQDSYQTWDTEKMSYRVDSITPTIPGLMAHRAGSF